MNSIDNTFVDYWREHDYQTICTTDSAPPAHLPNIDFSSCGAMHYGPIINGEEAVPSQPRIARIQRSVRPGSGVKIGYSPKHLTAFDMLDVFDLDVLRRLEQTLEQIIYFFAQHLNIGSDNLVINVSTGEEDFLAKAVKKVAQKYHVEVHLLSADQLVWQVKNAPHTGTRAEINWKKPDGDLWELWNISLINNQFLDSGGSMERADAARWGCNTVFDVGELAQVKARLAALNIDLSEAELHFLTDQVRSVTRLLLEGILPGGNSGRRIFVRNLLTNILGIFQRHGQLVEAEKCFSPEHRDVILTAKNNFERQYHRGQKALRRIGAQTSQVDFLSQLQQDPDTRWLANNYEALVSIMRAEGRSIVVPSGNMSEKSAALGGMPYYLVDLLEKQ